MGRTTGAKPRGSSRKPKRHRERRQERRERRSRQRRQVEDRERRPTAMEAASARSSKPSRRAGIATADWSAENRDAHVSQVQAARSPDRELPSLEQPAAPWHEVGSADAN